VKLPLHINKNVLQLELSFVHLKINQDNTELAKDLNRFVQSGDLSFLQVVHVEKKVVVIIKQAIAVTINLALLSTIADKTTKVISSVMVTITLLLPFMMTTIVLALISTIVVSTIPVQLSVMAIITQTPPQLITPVLQFIMGIIIPTKSLIMMVTTILVLPYMEVIIILA